MFVVDTNVLVYAADEDSPYHARCRDRLNTWRLDADFHRFPFLETVDPMDLTLHEPAARAGRPRRRARTAEEAS